MTAEYDMCVDYDALCTIEDELQKIKHNLDESVQKMSDAIKRSQDFLAGNQFEKAKNTTLKCIELTKNTGDNIEFARLYIVQLRSAIEEYGRCTYAGEG